VPRVHSIHQGSTSLSDRNIPGDQRQDPGQFIARVGFNQRLLLVAHIVLGAVAAVAYLSRIDFKGFHYWGRGGAWASALLSVPPLLPYIVSLVFSRSFEDSSRLRTMIFVSILSAGTAIAAYSYRYVSDFGFMNVFCLVMAQVIFLGLTAFVVLRSEL
jgi:hypothetical protein